MNRIVREHYPVAKLPDDLRVGLEPESDVRVVIEVHPPSKSSTPFDLQELFDRARPTFHSPEEVADHIRTIRDEWD